MRPRRCWRRSTSRARGTTCSPGRSTCRWCAAPRCQPLPDAEVALLRDSFTPEQHERLLADAEAIGARAVSRASRRRDPRVHRRGGRPRARCVLLVRAGRAPDNDWRRSAAAGLTGVVTDWPVDARRVLEAPGYIAAVCGANEQKSTSSPARWASAPPS